MSFIIRQQVQPAAIMVDMQSQQAWIMSQHALSPLTQVTQTPSLVISHLHIPIVKLQQHTMAPFIMQQQLHLAPAIMLHKFCNIPQAILSSHEQVIFIPPLHFSIFMLQRGIIIPVMAGAAAGMALPIIGLPMAGIIIPVLIGFMVAVVIIGLLCWSPPSYCHLGSRSSEVGFRYPVQS
ncbi:MAG TPA: hypothetical protein VNX28_12350 [Gemmataceae bacterium]|nr:hypothetical protein [Gemmataceae bacterium]